MSHIDIAVIKLSVMLHYIMLHYIMLHYIALHCIHYITYNNCKISLHKQFCFCKSFNFSPKCKSFGHHVSKKRLHVWISSYPWLSMRTASIMRQWKLNKKLYIRMTSIHWITIKTCRKDLIKCIRRDCQWRIVYIPYIYIYIYIYIQGIFSWFVCIRCFNAFSKANLLPGISIHLSKQGLSSVHHPFTSVHHPSTLFITHSTLSITHSTLSITHSTLFITHSTLFITHSPLFIPH